MDNSPDIENQDTDFYFLCDYDRTAIDQFLKTFSLVPATDALEIPDYENGTVVFEAQTLDGMWDWLQDHPNIPHTFYFRDQSDGFFTVAHLPGGLVFGIPYELLDDPGLLTLLVEFRAIFGWGSANMPPPDNMAEIEAAMRNRRSYFKAYRDGVLIPATPWTD